MLPQPRSALAPACRKQASPNSWESPPEPCSSGNKAAASQPAQPARYCGSPPNTPKSCANWPRMHDPQTAIYPDLSPLQIHMINDEVDGDLVEEVIFDQVLPHAHHAGCSNHLRR